MLPYRPKQHIPVGLRLQTVRKVYETIFEDHFHHNSFEGSVTLYLSRKHPWTLFKPVIRYYFLVLQKFTTSELANYEYQILGHMFDLSTLQHAKKQYDPTFNNPITLKEIDTIVVQFLHTQQADDTTRIDTD